MLDLFGTIMCVGVGVCGGGGCIRVDERERIKLEQRNQPRTRSWIPPESFEFQLREFQLLLGIKSYHPA